MQKLLEKYRYEFMAAIFMIANLIYYVPVIEELTHWCVTPYALNYDFGFISRGFMGTLVRLVFPNLTIKHIYVIILFNVLLLSGLTLFFMHKILARAYDKSKTGILFLLALFLVNPGSVTFLFYWGNFGRFDMYLLMALIISSLLIIYNKFVWFIPFMCVGAVMTHQAFVFQYFPAILVLLFYSAYVLKRKYGVALFVTTLIPTCIMFIYMQFFSEISYTYEETMNLLNLTTDLPEHYFTSDMMVRIEYYSSVFETFQVFVKEPLFRNVVKSLTFVVFLIPMIKIFVSLWKSFGKKQGLLCKLLPWFILVAEVPMFILTCDYGRDYAAIILCNFIVLFALYAMGDEGVVAGTEVLTEKIKADLPYYIFVLVLCAAIGKFTAADVGDFGHRFYTLLESILY